MNFIIFLGGFFCGAYLMGIATVAERRVAQSVMRTYIQANRKEI